MYNVNLEGAWGSQRLSGTSGMRTTFEARGFSRRGGRDLCMAGDDPPTGTGWHVCRIWPDRRRAGTDGRPGAQRSKPGHLLPNHCQADGSPGTAILPRAKGERMNRARGKRLPRFTSVQEEARFWQAHSPLEFRGAFREEPAEPSGRLETLLAVRFDRDTVALLRKVARAKGIGTTTLLRLWTIERLTETLVSARKGTVRRAG